MRLLLQTQDIFHENVIAFHHLTPNELLLAEAMYRIIPHDIRNIWCMLAKALFSLLQRPIRRSRLDRFNNYITNLDINNSGNCRTLILTNTVQLDEMLTRRCLSIFEKNLESKLVTHSISKLRNFFLVSLHALWLQRSFFRLKNKIFFFSELLLNNLFVLVSYCYCCSLSMELILIIRCNINWLTFIAVR